MYKREPFEPEPNVKLRCVYRYPGETTRVYTTLCPNARHADQLARVYAGLETTIEVTLYMPDDTSRIYPGPERRRGMGNFYSPIIRIGVPS